MQPDLMTAARDAVDPAHAVFSALDAELGRSPGHRLLTVLVYFEARGESQRAYSSQPLQYPVGGRKTLGQAPRMRKVLASGQPYLGAGRQDIVDNFADHALLLSMGCESIVNMPVLWGEWVLGTVNLLHAEGHYRAADLAWISGWAQASAPAFLSVLAGLAPHHR